MIVCITGGLGYIGSFCAVAFIEGGHDVIIIDNLSNSSTETLKCISNITGKLPDFYQIDLNDAANLNEFFRTHKIDCVVHCAAFKSVTESHDKPLNYYDNNVVGTINLVKSMKSYDCTRLIFSSSASVYGNPEKLPLDESSSTCPRSPYARTKLIVEQILQDVADADFEWKIVILRYFNPVGAHASGKLGDFNAFKDLCHNSNLFTYLLNVVSGKLDKLTIYGCDYPTPDGSCIRDFIHITDIADGHVKAIQKINDIHGSIIINLGTGNGYSILEVLYEMQKVSGKYIPFEYGEKRKGDIVSSYASVDQAYEILGWKAKKTLKDMCKDSLLWYKS